MARRGFGNFSRRERTGTFVGIGVAGIIAAVVYSPETLKEFSAARGEAKRDPVLARGPRPSPLNGPGRVMAINVAADRVQSCYRAEFGKERHREQVVIVAFWAEIAGGVGRVFEGEVPAGEAVSMSFDRCVREELAEIDFASSHASGRQRITFPFVFDLSGEGIEG